MAFFQGLCTIDRFESIGKGFYSMWVTNMEMAQAAKAGQFAQVKAEGFFLRRPISICEIDKAGGRLRLVFEVRGEGTRKLATLRSGQQADIVAPLGNGFELLHSSKKAIMVGGGIGSPPMLEPAKHYRANATVILGFRNKDAVILEEDFKQTEAKVLITSDDGSCGEQGLVTEPLEECLQAGGYDIIYACGPLPMLKATASLAGRYGVRCQVSLEERMACGVGACLTCACKAKQRNGEETYLRVCKTGPVFEAGMVFDEDDNTCR